ncbi:MAG: hypothetical protein JWN29_1429 [Acidimicrobiales bacterium]|nr:hypothetical protein [Acidimicrobiales bacterium]
MPALAVIVATRNRAELIAGAVASVQAQTVDDLEIVVVDDGSTDGTTEVLDRLAAEDRRVVVVRGPGVGSPGAARNAGLRATSAEVVAFCDDDDRWHPAKAERQLAVLRSRPTLVAVSCHHEIVGDGRRLAHRGPTDPTAEELLWCSFAGGTSFAMVARDRAGTEATFAEDLPTCEDWDLFARCGRTGGVAVVPEVLVAYRAHNGADRLTVQPAGRHTGHERFLERHRDAMTPDCVAYHAARARIRAAGNPRDRLRLLPDLVREASPLVRRALAAESLAGRTGRLLGDPARSMRHLLRVLRSRP